MKPFGGKRTDSAKRRDRGFGRRAESASSFGRILWWTVRRGSAPPSCRSDNSGVRVDVGRYRGSLRGPSGRWVAVLASCGVRRPFTARRGAGLAGTDRGVLRRVPCFGTAGTPTSLSAFDRRGPRAVPVRLASVRGGRRILALRVRDVDDRPGLSDPS